MRKASRRFVAQSAMEFMMTYAWAIVIIAVALAFLFGLGVFNQFSFAPKAQAGSCYMYRPYGPYNTKLIQLEGICQGEIPQYVAQFDGKADYVDAGASGALESASNTAVFMWAYIMPPANIYGPQIFQSMDSCVTNGYFIALQNGVMKVVSGTGSTNPGDFSAPSSITLSTWHQVGFTWTSTGSGTSNQMMIIDGNVVAQRNIGIGTPSARTSNALIGKVTQCWTLTPFNGLMANVQLYNTSLTSNEIKVLYVEGIGGAPIRIQNLVAWWPLNGDTNDYSGNNNKGIASGISFASQWMNGYVPP